MSFRLSLTRDVAHSGSLSVNLLLAPVLLCAANTSNAAGWVVRLQYVPTGSCSIGRFRQLHAQLFGKLTVFNKPGILIFMLQVLCRKCAPSHLHVRINRHLVKNGLCASSNLAVLLQLPSVKAQRYLVALWLLLHPVSGSIILRCCRMQLSKSSLSRA